MENFDVVYNDILGELLSSGERQQNRTGVDTFFRIGKFFELDVSVNFPLLTTKKVYWQAAFAEMLGFIRGYDSAAKFRQIGCRVWDANANANHDWIANPSRKGTDDLGRIYGCQWRNWISPTGQVDQLQLVINDLRVGIDNRREVVTAWNPGEMDLMALPPCHMTMIFSLACEKAAVDLFVLVRSNDVFLGMPFNVAQYAFLLHLIAHISNKKPGHLRYYANNYHLYETHVEAARVQKSRMPMLVKPRIELNSSIKTLADIESVESIHDLVQVHDYVHHPAISVPMAV